MDLPPDSLSEVDPEILRRLNEAWLLARRAGVLGSLELKALRMHASGYILDHWRSLRDGIFVDCGTGAGVPGVLLALELPESRWRLVDAQERRCELAQLAVAAAGLVDRVTVDHATLEDIARSELRESCQGAVARSFGPASELAECGLPLLAIGATLVLSVSATTRRQWQRLPLAERTGCKMVESWSTPHGSYVAVTRTGATPCEIPRRRAARVRSPLG